MRARVLAGALAVALSACTGAVSKTPGTTSTPISSAASTAKSSSRIVVSNSTLSGSDTGRYLLFQLPGENHLRAISWDALRSGVLGGEVAPDAIWSAQSPDGSRYVLNGIVYDRQGHSLGALPWIEKGTSASWSTDGRFLCEDVPATPISGARMTLQTARPGQSADIVANGYAIYNDNAAYPVLTCDPTTDRAIVAVLGQGIALGDLWVFRLSTGSIIREYRQPGSWVAVSADGSLLALATPQANGAGWLTTVRRADDGVQVGMVDDFTAHGFSSDASMLVGVTGGNATVLLNWRTGRRVWSSTGLPYGGFLAEPGGNHIAIGMGFTGGSDTADVYIVAPDRSAVLLPARLRAALQY
jgi:hypothetical protein